MKPGVDRLFGEEHVGVFPGALPVLLVHCQVDGGFWIADASRGRYQVGRDGDFSIGHAARTGKYKSKGTVVGAYMAGVRALDPRGAK